MERRDALSRLVFELAKLPGVGEKTATRLSYFILKQDDAYVRSLADALTTAKQTIRPCQRCFTYTDTELCGLCQNPARNSALLCVVERPSDVHAIEQTGSFRGRYHVLHGVLSPLDGIGPEQLKIRELLMRLETLIAEGVTPEVILATNPSVDGETTAYYLSNLLKPLGIRVTRLAYGIPIGGQLQYSDRQTIHKAMEHRVDFS